MNRNVVRSAGAVAALAGVMALAACSSSDTPGPQPGAPSTPAPGANAKHGPMFPESGGVSDQTVQQLTQVSGLVNTAKNSVGNIR